MYPVIVDSQQRQRVEVYWNIRRGCFSVRYCHGTLIPNQPHRTEMHLEDVHWVVQQGGRERVLREGKKNVHAFARGWMRATYTDRNHEVLRQRIGNPLADIRSIAYNPYKMKTFQAKADGAQIVLSDLASFYVNGKGQPQIFGFNNR